MRQRVLFLGGQQQDLLDASFRSLCRDGHTQREVCTRTVPLFQVSSCMVKECGSMHASPVSNYRHTDSLDKMDKKHGQDCTML